MAEQTYYTKKSVYGDNPLKEVIYEIEDAYEYDPFLEIQFVRKEKLQDILFRHSNTVKAFKEKLSKMIN